MSIAVVQIINGDSMLNNAKAFNCPCQLEIDIHGKITKLSIDEFCPVCKGKKSRRYWYSQDESVQVNCYLCNNGNKEQWLTEEQAWNQFCKQDR